MAYSVTGKAFSFVSHNILMLELEFYGILVKFNILIKFYLRGSYWTVLIRNKNTHNSSSSGWEKIKHGVPQG